ncbi:hypothetical protein [Staphylococcus xylosus]|uniref:hypothetical protein n=1 Tax=Staphylococcus xylosus TaxID=1288 RepID=UPI0004F730FC|nr:hypothetical protein [Staphylococcus xylosus]MBG3874276.1 hypothetical protein [Staphylococcus xylosus]MBM6638955.1 hypothetical protein [Staphylococcus xylosus]MCA2498790.1 hypothetical protein [Staphylococcus xylosus]MCA2503910.1 hypothetical protein [Staphylococcus xylosus]MCE7781094.1 hypothetical protein [Staphylococcus xylosus]
MYYFVAILKDNETEIQIISEENIIDDKRITIPNKNYVHALAEEIIELSHQNQLYHNDIKRIGLCTNDYKVVGYDTTEALQKDLASTFGFEAIIDNNYEHLLAKLIK